MEPPPEAINLAQVAASIAFEREDGPAGGYNPSEFVDVVVKADGETVTFERGSHRWYCDQVALAAVVVGLVLT